MFRFEDDKGHTTEQEGAECIHFLKDLFLKDSKNAYFVLENNTMRFERKCNVQPHDKRLSARTRVHTANMRKKQQQQVLSNRDTTLIERLSMQYHAVSLVHDVHVKISNRSGCKTKSSSKRTKM